MKIVIGGANGLIGRRLVKRLRGEGHEVVALVRRASADAAGARPVEWNGRDLGPWAQELASAGAVVNLAGANVGERRWTAAVKREIRRSRVDSTRALLQGLATADPKPSVFVSASAVGTYGSRSDEELTEESATGEGFLASVVQDWECEAGKSELQGVRGVQVRIGVVLAPEPEGGALQKMVPPFRAYVGGPLGDGRQWFPWVHVDDVAGLFSFALARPELRGPVNAVAPQPVRMEQFAQALGRTLGRPSLFRVPLLALRLAVGEFADELVASQRVLPRKALAAGYRFAHTDLDETLRALLPS